MQRVLLLAFVLFIPLSACGGGRSDDAAIDALPRLAPTLSEVQAQFPQRADDPAEVNSDYWPNKEVSDWRFGSVYYDLSADDLKDNGLVTGYGATYILGRQNSLHPTTTGVTVLVDLYEDEESAAREVARLPLRATRSDVDPALGDQALAWGYEIWTAPSGLEPRCPCDFRFRVGRIVGFVHVEYPGPLGASHAYGEDFDPVAHELARLMAERMSEALAQS